MEDHKDQSNSNDPKGAVMDVQPPRPVETPAAEPSQQPTVPAPVAPVAAAPEPSQPVSEAPTPEVNVTHEPARQGLSPELLAQAEKETNKPGQDKQLLAAHASHKNRGPIVAVVVAIIIALSLAGVAVYAYLQSRDDKVTDTNNMTSHESTPATQPASTKDVDDAARELDDTINAKSESSEIPGDGLSEESVGL